MVAFNNSIFSRIISLLISVWILCDVLPVYTQAAIKYEVIDLGTLGGDSSYAESINDSGQIVGYDSTQINEWVYHARAVLFDSTGDGKNIELSGIDGGVARSINNSGQIVGDDYTQFDESSAGHAVIFDPSETNNNIRLGTLGGGGSTAECVNNIGQIVGLASNNQNQFRATLFDASGNGNNIDLGTLGGDSSIVSTANEINDAGQIVGRANYGPRSVDYHATLFDPTGTNNIIDLGTLGGDESEAVSINNAGQIVGWSAFKPQLRVFHATLFDPTGTGNNIDLGTLEGNVSAALSINDAGQIVGNAWNNNRGCATLFDSTGAGNNIDLNTLVDPNSGWVLTSAKDINNNGWIVGQGINPQGESHAFLLVPIYPKYSGGTGEPNDPYQIATAEDLMLLGETPEDYDKHFILTAGIDLDPNLPGREVFDRAVIAPVVNDNEDWFQETAFAGVFDGDGHSINNLHIHGGMFLGLFGLLGPEGRISHLGLEAVDVNGTDSYIGGLVGKNIRGSITTCYSTGTVTGNRIVGGLVGENDGGAITTSYSTATVTGTVKWVGGLVGNSENYGGIIACYSTGTVTGNTSVGGLVGILEGSITSSYSTASVNGDSRIGGLLGIRDSGVVTNSYSTGAVTGNEDIGGLVGYSAHYWQEATPGSFWDMETSGQVISVGGTGLTTVEMQTTSTLLDTGWDFVDEAVNGPNDVWKMWDGYDYPRLAWEPGPNTPLVFVDINDPGFYGQMSKYEVTNAQYCDFLNAALATGDITVDGTDVEGAGGSNAGADYVGQRYYRCDGSGYTGYGATNGGASRIHFNEGAFGVDEGFGNHPVTYVSWYGAMAFANYYGYYLPTEEQWQAVADYDGTYIYGCGQSIDPGIANYRNSEHPDGTTPVGSFGIYGYGMSDMAGNVWEWTSSSLDDNRIFRGGGMGSIDSDCAVSIRGDGIPYANYWDIGFRVCR